MRNMRALLIALAATLAFAAPASAQSPNLVINEIDYDQPALDTSEFLEIRNNAAAPVNLDPYALQFVNGANNGIYTTADLPAVALAAGGHYVVCGNPATVPECDLDIGNVQDLIQNGAPDAVAIVNAGAIVDTVSYEGTVPGYQEGALTAPSDTGGAANIGISRVPDGCDTDQNGDDFDVVATTPGASNGGVPCGGPPVERAPLVEDTSPANNQGDVALDSNVSITFSEDVSTSGEWYSISCSSTGAHSASVTGGPRTYTLDPATDFGLNETCTVTVRAANVTDADTNDPPDQMDADHTFSFTTIAPTYRIREIQGTAHMSPLVGQRTSFVPGVVTAVRNNGFWMQDPSPDADPATSEGLFVFTSSASTVLQGAGVTVSGRITEFRPGGASSDNLTLTQLDTATVYPAGPGAAIAPTVVGNGGRVPPGQVIDDDATGSVETSGLFQPTTDGIDFYESLESMVLQVNDAVAVGPRNDFGEIFVVADNGANAGPRTSRGGVVIAPGDFNPERIQFDDVLAATPVANVGDRFPGATVGVLSYDFGNFELLPRTAPARVSGGLQREITAVPRHNEQSVATFNVENLDPSDAPTIPRLAQIVVNNLRSPDLIGIEEMQDNTGGTNDGTTDASLSWQAFIDAIVAAGGPRYEYRQIDPENNADGGQPGGNIRVGFLFRTERGLRFVDSGEGDATTPTRVFRSRGEARLTLSPGRVDPQNPAWAATRKPLAGEFLWKDQRFIAIVSHFSSKGGDDPLFGRWQPPVRSTEVARHQQAASVNAFVDQVLAADHRANVIVLGDINDFEFSETTRILEGAVLTSLLHGMPKAERYSYVFEGNSQVLDQILVSNNALSKLRAFDVVHVNAEFADQASDHDPSVARLELDE